MELNNGQPMAAEDATDQQADMTNGFVIEVHVTPDGQISVTVEPKSAEDAEGAHDESEAQVVNSPREAAKLVVDIINSQGAMKDTGADDAAMEQGFKPGMQ
jgi:hypothetical protein